MVASESAELIVEKAAMKTNVLESGEGEPTISPLEEIDYVNGRDYRSVSPIFI